MLNTEQKLQQNIFTGPEQVPIRKGFGTGLLQAGKDDERVVGLCADLTESTQMHLFRDAFPQRFVEIGVAEQNLASVASGMAAMGKRPFVSSYAMFSPGRNWEQIRTTIAYNDRGVVVAGSHAGVSVGPDGGTHQAIEDIAITRVIPNMIVVSPCDYREAHKATLALAKLGKPAYLRLAREKTPVMTTDETPFEIGNIQRFFGEVQAPVAVLATGALLYKALKVADALAREGVVVSVWNVATIKPLDTDTLATIATSAKGLVTVEEHQIHGGLGSAVAEHLASTHPLPIEFVGVRDQFGQSGKPDELLEHYGMGEAGIREAITNLLKRI